MFLTALASPNELETMSLYGTGYGKVVGNLGEKRNGYKQEARLNWDREIPAGSKPQDSYGKCGPESNWGTKMAEVSYDTVLFQGINGEKQG